ncbi:MAG: hypothetical protein ACYTFG_18170 [Planctomycetota bacterium]|jgi:hypothetical protein
MSRCQYCNRPLPDGGTFCSSEVVANGVRFAPVGLAALLPPPPPLGCKELVALERRVKKGAAA